jgi:microsomal epoxide hydrolase
MRPALGIGRRELALGLGAAALWPSAALAEAAAADRFFTTSDGVRLHYLEAGPSGARTLVFVPGWRMPAFVWTRQISAFSRDFRVLAFDPRGQGESDAPAGGYEPARRGRDLGELIEQAASEPVVVVAWSLGVLDALAYVAEAGDGRVAALVLVDNSIGEEPAPKPSARRPAPRTPEDDAQRMRAFVAGLFESAQDPAFVEEITKASLRTPPSAARQLLAYPEPRAFWRDAVYSTRKPVLYVVRPRWAAQGENLVRKHPSAELSVFEHSGHALFLDQPDRFNATLADFLKRKVWP